MRKESYLKYGALYQLDEFLLNPQARVQSGPLTETTRNSKTENQETNEDRYQSDAHSEVGGSLSQSSQEFSLHETSYMAAGFHEQFSYCSPRTSPGKQNPQIDCEYTSATIEADLIYLGFQQLPSTSNSANFNKIVCRVSKLPESLTTTTPTSVL